MQVIFFKIIIFLELPIAGGLNPDGLLPDAQCSELMERVAGSTPSLPSTQLHLSQMYHEKGERSMVSSNSSISP